MAKLDRQNQLIFATNSGSREITGFGTAMTSSPTYTRDVSVIQNANYLQGWQSAILPDKAPYLEDTNALFYLLSRQLAYQFQEGVAEWNSETSYYIGSLAKYLNSSNEVTIYKSLTNDNVGNNPESTAGTYWKVFYTEHQEIALATYEIGLPQPTFSNSLYANEIWLEGATVSRTTYANLFSIYGTTYGAGDGSTTFVLPDCRNRAFWGSTSFGYISAGLPSLSGTTSNAGAHTHTRGSMNITGVFDADDLNNDATSPTATGAFYTYKGGRRDAEDGVTQYGGGYAIGFNAASSWSGATSSNGAHTHTVSVKDSGSIVGNSSTVQPPAIKCRIKTRWY